MEFFKNIFNDRFDVISFSENSLLKIAEIQSREAELRNDRGYSDNYRWAAGRFLGRYLRFTMPSRSLGMDALFGLMQIRWRSRSAV